MLPPVDVADIELYWPTSLADESAVVAVKLEPPLMDLANFKFSLVTSQ